MKPSAYLLGCLLLHLLTVPAWGTVKPSEHPHPSPKTSTPKTYTFVNGHWFNGHILSLDTPLADELT
jgi:hypothetical protein